MNKLENYLDKLKKYRLEIRHIIVIFITLLFFQIILSFIQKGSLREFLVDTKEWYKKDTAERIANLTTTSIELLFENFLLIKNRDAVSRIHIVNSMDIIFNQPLVQQNVEKIALIFEKGDEKFLIDDGEKAAQFILDELPLFKNESEIINLYSKNRNFVYEDEIIFSQLDKEGSFDILVPFVIYGEVTGALYMKNTPDFSILTGEIISSYEEAAVIYSSLIILGLLAMFYISSYSVRERDEAQDLLIKEHETNLKQKIEHEKETQFTKRIYHAHHKAEKVIGFIREDLRVLTSSNLEFMRQRLGKYVNFVSRVIYDMKWYDPPINTIRGQLFNTDINKTLIFLIENLFRRVTINKELFQFKLNLDENFPSVKVNEYIVWEIFEPIIQNSFDHRGENEVLVTISTKYDAELKKSYITFSDNGNGIVNELLEYDDNGVQRIFIEHSSTKTTENQNKGYGCYIAYTMAVKRCGWKLRAVNNFTKGCSFIFEIENG